MTRQNVKERERVHMQAHARETEGEREEKQAPCKTASENTTPVQTGSGTAPLPQEVECTTPHASHRRHAQEPQAEDRTARRAVVGNLMRGSGQVRCEHDNDVNITTAKHLSKHTTRPPPVNTTMTFNATTTANTTANT